MATEKKIVKIEEIKDETVKTNDSNNAAETNGKPAEDAKKEGWLKRSFRKGKKFVKEHKTGVALTCAGVAVGIIAAVAKGMAGGDEEKSNDDEIALLPEEVTDEDESEDEIEIEETC